MRQSARTSTNRVMAVRSTGRRDSAASHGSGAGEAVRLSGLGPGLRSRKDGVRTARQEPRKPPQEKAQPTPRLKRPSIDRAASASDSLPDSSGAEKELGRTNSTIAEVIQKHSATQTEPLTPGSPMIGATTRRRSRTGTADTFEDMLAVRSLDPRNWASASPIIGSMERQAATLAQSSDATAEDSSIANSLAMMMYGGSASTCPPRPRGRADSDAGSIGSTPAVLHPQPPEDPLQSTTAERDRYHRVCEDVSLRVATLISTLAKRVGTARFELVRDKLETPDEVASGDVESTAAATTRDEVGSSTKDEIGASKGSEPPQPELLTREVLDVLQTGLAEVQAILDISLRVRGDFRILPPPSSGFRTPASPCCSPTLPPRGNRGWTTGVGGPCAESDAIDHNLGPLPMPGSLGFPTALTMVPSSEMLPPSGAIPSTMYSARTSASGAYSVPTPASPGMVRRVPQMPLVCPFCHCSTGSAAAQSMVYPRWLPSSRTCSTRTGPCTPSTPAKQVVRPPPSRAVSSPATTRFPGSAYSEAAVSQSGCASPFYSPTPLYEPSPGHFSSTPPVIQAPSRSIPPSQCSTPFTPAPSVTARRACSAWQVRPRTGVDTLPHRSASARHRGSESVPPPLDGKVVRVRRRTLRKCWVVDREETVEFRLPP
mmetsp:Transcript_2414/g.5147  ORF Transcript_2414/g.5147 Transcript_2414/m.5147 type:complete len:657 (+) Transcript_2414:86-2056(+)